MKPLNISIILLLVLITVITGIWFTENRVEKKQISFRLNAINDLQISEIDDVIIEVGSISLRELDGDWSIYSYLNEEVKLREIQNLPDGILLDTAQIKDKEYDMIRISFTNIYSERIRDERGISIPTQNIDIPIETPVSDEYISSILFSIDTNNSLLQTQERSISYVFLPHILLTARVTDPSKGSGEKVYIKNQVHVNADGDIRYGTPKNKQQNSASSSPANENEEVQSE